MYSPGKAPFWASLRSGSWGLLVFCSGALVDHLVSYAGVSALMALVDDLIIGIVAAFLIVLYEHRKRRMISLMNHHVRNALQVIVYATHVQGHPDQRIGEAVARIEWALTEVLTSRADVDSA